MKFRLLSLLLVMATCGCTQHTVKNYTEGPDVFEKRLLTQPGVQLLDVRTPTEYNSGHIAGSMQANWNDKTQFFDRVQYLDKSRPVYIYCLSGGRTTAAAAWMRQNGFQEVVELSGGINAWKRAGKPVEGLSGEPQLTPEQYLSSIPKDKITLVDVGATWCPPCVKMEPVLKDLEKDKDLHFVLLKIDAGVHTDLLKYLGIEPIPVFIVYKNGIETWRKQGIVSREELAAQLR